MGLKEEQPGVVNVHRTNLKPNYHLAEMQTRASPACQSPAEMVRHASQSTTTDEETSSASNWNFIISDQISALALITAKRKESDRRIRQEFLSS